MSAVVKNTQTKDAIAKGFIPTQNISQTDFPAIQRNKLTTLQVNIGYKCNLTCAHCHVDASPRRTEMMSDELIKLIPEVIKAHNIDTLDITGGAPEMHEQFKELVLSARGLGVKVIDRCNLTILTVAGYEDMAAFLAENQVEVVASMPCYSAKNVNKQRGDGVFDDSITGLKMLNGQGYGKADSGLVLNLVYNPLGAFLPPNQQSLEQDYKRELKKHFDIEFNQLFALTNMPIKRFANFLRAKKQYSEYMTLLKDNFDASNLEGVMCKNTISVDYQGDLYDCDFNQQLKMALPNTEKTSKVTHLKNLLNVDLTNNPIAIADHCYGCTAGQGSSCGGALD